MDKVVYLATPTGGRVDYRMARCVARDSQIIVDRWDVAPGPCLSANRNALLQNYLKTELPYFVSVDDDVWWGENVIWYMMKVLKVYGGVVFVDMPERQWETTAYNWEDGELVPAPKWDTPFRSDAFGSSMFGMTLDFAKTLPPFPFDLRFRGGYQRREDLSFSITLEEMGVRPICIPKMNVIHYCDYEGKRPR